MAATVGYRLCGRERARTRTHACSAVEIGMNISRSLLDDLIAHAREEYDEECCGMIAYAPAESGGEPRAMRVHRARNIHASRKRFEIDGLEVLRTMDEFENEDAELGAIYHSHTHTAPYPSQTDINFAANWPGLEWVIVGLAGEEPEVRCYLIEDGAVREVELRVR
ncbi:MAG TPA: M67 family metallopeptidase [Solirubrobacteraceae bacterium]|nr:M67 family metallopeptidase [Solirubrobacteraceae bacterium]